MIWLKAYSLDLFTKNETVLLKDGCDFLLISSTWHLSFYTNFKISTNMDLHCRNFYGADNTIITFNLAKVNQGSLFGYLEFNICAFEFSSLLNNAITTYFLLKYTCASNFYLH